MNVAKWLSTNPAKLIGQSYRKGKIEKGYDADLVVFDANRSFTVIESLIQHKHKVTPYLGQELFGIVEQTYLHGNEVYGNGIFTRLNQGRIITR